MQRSTPSSASTSASPAREFRCSVADRLTGLDVRDLSSSDRSDWLRNLTEVEAMVAGARSRVMSAAPGTRSTRHRERSAELVRQTGMSGTDASRAVRLADTLDAVPAVAEALAEGQITAGHASALAGGVSWMNRPAAALDGSLIEAARIQSVDEFKVTVAGWERAENGDADGSNLAARQHRNRAASWFTRDDGMVRIQADLPPDSGAMVTGALQSMAEYLWRTEDGRTAGPGSAREGATIPGTTIPDAGNDVRSSRQRNADALVKLVRRPTRTEGGPVGDPGRARIDLLVAVDLDRLQVTESASAGRCATTDGVELPVATVRRLACDAGVIPAVLDRSGAVLDIGRRTRTVPRAIRHALALRDGGCAFPGCSSPVSWCDAHHVRYWSDGGPTSLDNLVLLCSTHHHLVHEDRWIVECVADGHHRFRSPIGTELTVRPEIGTNGRSLSGPRPGTGPGP